MDVPKPKTKAQQFEAKWLIWKMHQQKTTMCLFGSWAVWLADAKEVPENRAVAQKLLLGCQPVFLTFGAV